MKKIWIIFCISILCFSLRNDSSGLNHSQWGSPPVQAPTDCGTGPVMADMRHDQSTSTSVLGRQQLPDAIFVHTHISIYGELHGQEQHGADVQTMRRRRNVKQSECSSVCRNYFTNLPNMQISSFFPNFSKISSFVIPCSKNICVLTRLHENNTSLMKSLCSFMSFCLFRLQGEGGGVVAVVTLEEGTEQHAKNINVREPHRAPAPMAEIQGAYKSVNRKLPHKGTENGNNLNPETWKHCRPKGLVFGETAYL